MAEGTDSLTRQKERQLIERARAGDRVAAREIIDFHKDRLYAFIWRMVRNSHDAEDICQDAFLKAFSSIDSFSTEYRFSTWLFTIGYRICLNQLRRKRAVTGDLDFDAIASTHEDDSSEAVSEEVDRLRHLVWSAVDKLTPPQRATTLLFYRHEMGCHEISRVLQLPVATVKSHLHRARGRLREMLEPLSEQDLGHFRNLGWRVG